MWDARPWLRASASLNPHARPSPLPSSPPAGGAPLTKGLFWTTVASSLAADVLAKRARGRPSLAGALLRGLQFQGPSALFIGASMLYCFRVLERLEGPARSAGARLAACGAAWVAQSALCRVLGLAPVPGPYLLVFSDLVSYWQAVPSLQDFAVGGVQLNDKLFVYAGCAQLALLAGQPGLVAAAAGLLGGALWNANAANVQNWKVGVLGAWLCAAWAGIASRRPCRRTVGHACSWFIPLCPPPPPPRLITKVPRSAPRIRSRPGCMAR